MQISKDIPECVNEPRIMKTDNLLFFFFKHVMGNDGSFGDFFGVVIPGLFSVMLVFAQPLEADHD